MTHNTLSYRYLRATLCAIVVCCFVCNTFSQENYDYENWPGKNGVTKNHINFPDQLILKHSLFLTKGSTNERFFYKISLNESDKIKKGRIQVRVLSNTEKAQFALIEYLDWSTNPNKPPRLKTEEYIAGDVAFGKEIGDEVRMAFSRNNILVVIHAPKKEVVEIAHEIDKQIQIAPEWTTDDPSPSFNLKN